MNEEQAHAYLRERGWIPCCAGCGSLTYALNAYPGRWYVLRRAMWLQRRLERVPMREDEGFPVVEWGIFVQAVVYFSGKGRGHGNVKKGLHAV